MPSLTSLTFLSLQRVGINAETVTNVSSTDFPGHWPGEDHSWDLEHFKQHVQVQFHTNHELDSSFSLTRIDTSLANAFRRILLAEIPTLAIESVFIFQNTSVIQDEVLAHRLGLIPLCGDRSAISWLKWHRGPAHDDPDAKQDELTDYNSCVLELEVACEWADGGLAKAAQGETNPDVLYKNHSVYARDLIWKPVGRQHDKFDKAQPLKAANPDILIAKMRPGQSIRLVVHAFKGIGMDHAKFSPVATASYRLLPTIDIVRPIVGAEAKKFARCFPKGVIALEKVTRDDARKNKELEGKEGEVKAVVKDPMRDTVSRECLRHPEFKDKVKLGRVRDHFIFRVESTGQWASDELFLESVRLLRVKCERVKRGLEALTR
ncbi:DNA-directed RNA polymerase [Clohesyomyces aquaticus]|uniref:DNA-directed RNA polymerases I and III subunit RPAC1 n=1 Tax=Clohesyomyces aquaticus TaxID=1231657 RepID=A0A1Y1YPF9_9PLEO|nr:DNA-directed RNA polymerase [Clohesyomyces aquaticus]